MGSGKILKQSINKYGIGNFGKRILIKDIYFKEIIDELEIEFITIYKSLDKAEYNISKGGDGGNLLKYASEEKKREIFKKISIANSGKNHPLYGRKHTEKTKDKISKSHRGKTSPNKGKHPTEESRQKMSIARKKYWQNKKQTS
jgi:group I intron endonuclease